MNAERSILSAVAFLVAAALTTPAARAEMPRDCNGADAGVAKVARVIDGRSFLLADGREVRLAAIETPLLVPGDEDEARAAVAQESRAALEELVLNREIRLSSPEVAADRYGRVTAWAFAQTPSGTALVQHELVAAGHALVSPVPATPCRIYLRAAEQEARSRGLGVWGKPYSMVKNSADPADVLADQGRFVLVQGKVASVRESGGIIYINFGRRRSDQFTATLLKRNEGAFTNAGLAPKALAGRTVEVRGWVEERGGPAVDVTRPEQIEIVH